MPDPIRKAYHFRLYRDLRGEWRWRLKAANGLTLADSGEGYKTRTGAVNAIERLRSATLQFVR